MSSPSPTPDDAPTRDDAPTSHDAPTPPEGSQAADAGEAPAPSAEELERTATPVTVRRAPRYRAFVMAGVALGLLLTVPAVLLGPGEQVLGFGPVVFFTAVGFTLVGALVGAVVAVVADRRSRR